VINDVINEIGISQYLLVVAAYRLDEAVTEKNLSTDDIDGADGTEVIVFSNPFSVICDIRVICG